MLEIILTSIFIYFFSTCERISSYSVMQILFETLFVFYNMMMCMRFGHNCQIHLFYFLQLNELCHFQHQHFLYKHSGCLPCATS